MRIVWCVNEINQGCCKTDINNNSYTWLLTAPWQAVNFQSLSQRQQSGQSKCDVMALKAASEILPHVNLNLISRWAKLKPSWKKNIMLKILNVFLICSSFIWYIITDISMQWHLFLFNSFWIIIKTFWVVTMKIHVDYKWKVTDKNWINCVLISLYSFHRTVII